LKRRLTSFDAECVRPDRYRQLFAELSSPRLLITRGAGLTYCAASAGENVVSVDARNFNRILEFDPTTGCVTVEAGITLGDLYRFTVPRDWILPVMPGSPTITVGGCIAPNIHGKNQFKDATFAWSRMNSDCFTRTMGRLFVHRVRGRTSLISPSEDTVLRDSSCRHG